MWLKKVSCLAHESTIIVLLERMNAFGELTRVV